MIILSFELYVLLPLHLSVLLAPIISSCLYLITYLKPITVSLTLRIDVLR